METEVSKNNKMKKILIAVSVLCVIFIITIILGTLSIMDANEKAEQSAAEFQKMANSYSVTQKVLNKETNRADSLKKILVDIADYMPMASTLQYRDSVCSKLPHKAGDIVYMKPDSSIWVITAVSIKGGKWQHTINYVLRNSTSTELEVVPEIVY